MNLKGKTAINNLLIQIHIIILIINLLTLTKFLMRVQFLNTNKFLFYILGKNAKNLSPLKLCKKYKSSVYKVEKKSNEYWYGMYIAKNGKLDRSFFDI